MALSQVSRLFRRQRKRMGWLQTRPKLGQTEGGKYGCRRRELLDADRSIRSFACSCSPSFGK